MRFGAKCWKRLKFPDVQETETGKEFAQKLAANAFSPEFKQAYDAYMDKFGCRGIREIDIAKHFKNQVALQNNMGYREMLREFFA